MTRLDPDYFRIACDLAFQRAARLSAPTQAEEAVMTKAVWLDRAAVDAEALRSLVRDWHPLRRPTQVGDITITAEAAEHACEHVRREIVATGGGDPVELFTLALRNGDVRTIVRLLNEAWFGVPESRDCWKIRGFTEAVDLLDEPPEND